MNQDEAAKLKAAADARLANAQDAHQAKHHNPDKPFRPEHIFVEIKTTKAVALCDAAEPHADQAVAKLIAELRIGLNNARGYQFVNIRADAVATIAAAIPAPAQPAPQEASPTPPSAAEASTDEPPNNVPEPVDNE